MILCDLIPCYDYCGNVYLSNSAFFLYKTNIFVYTRQMVNSDTSGYSHRLEDFKFASLYYLFCQSNISVSDVLSFHSQWFLRPTLDLAVLHRRQEVIRFFTSPRNSDALSTLQSSLRNISNIPVTTLTNDLLLLHFYHHLSFYLLCYHLNIEIMNPVCVCVCVCVC